MVILTDEEAKDLAKTIAEAIASFEDRTPIRQSWPMRPWTGLCCYSIELTKDDPIMSHPAPIRRADPEIDKRAALKLAASAAQRADVAESTRNNAIRFAAEQGASLREIAASIGLSHMTVKRILERSASDA